MNAWDESRRGWAQRLHSTVAQQLAALRLNQAILEAVPLTGRQARALRENTELAEAAARDLQQVIAELYPPLLDPFGLLAALRALGAAQNIEPVSELPESLRLAPETEIGIYRIAEAAIAGATGIRLARDEEMLLVWFDGVSQIPPGVAERVADLGGRLSLEPRGLGVRIPLTDAES
jgi:signal transduction histidine kinase